MMQEKNAKTRDQENVAFIHEHYLKLGYFPTLCNSTTCIFVPNRNHLVLTVAIFDCSLCWSVNLVMILTFSKMILMFYQR